MLPSVFSEKNILPIYDRFSQLEFDLYIISYKCNYPLNIKLVTKVLVNIGMTSKEKYITWFIIQRNDKNLLETTHN